MPTHEVIKGVSTGVDAEFRKYHSIAESIEDHALFLRDNPRYKLAFDCKTIAGFVETIAHCGYSTTPDYANLLIALIKQHDLTQYD